MSARFNNLRVVRQVPTLGEAMTTWIAAACGVLLVVLAGYLLATVF